MFVYCGTYTVSVLFRSRQWYKMAYGCLAHVEIHEPVQLLFSKLLLFVLYVYSEGKAPTTN